MPQLERQRRKQSLMQFALAVALLIIVNVLANARLGDTPLYGALDLTEDKRFTLTDNTVAQLRELEEPLFVRVLLDGNLPLNYARLRDKVEESLIDFAGYSDQLEWEFADPLAGNDPEAIRDRQRQLQEDLKILPVNVFSTQGSSTRSLNSVYPYAILYYGQRVTVVRFFESNLPDVSEERRINQAEALLEYNFSKAIRAITNNDKGLIGFTTGHGELPS
ncbi:MAG: GldG family protein, partial [Bacteroidota bacterium]